MAAAAAAVGAAATPDGSDTGPASGGAAAAAGPASGTIPISSGLTNLQARGSGAVTAGAVPRGTALAAAWRSHFGPLCLTKEEVWLARHRCSGGHADSTDTHAGVRDPRADLAIGGLWRRQDPQPRRQAPEGAAGCAGLAQQHTRLHQGEHGRALGPPCHGDPSTWHVETPLPSPGPGHLGCCCLSAVHVRAAPAGRLPPAGGPAVHVLRGCDPEGPCMGEAQVGAPVQHPGGERSIWSPAPSQLGQGRVHGC